MTNLVQTDSANRSRPLRTILLILALLTSPLICCGTTQLLDALPASLLPPSWGFTLNFFESEARVKNQTAETFYLTAITTTYGKPQVIAQDIDFRQRDILLEPKSSITLRYDLADLPLAGIAVCKTTTDCRLLAVDYSGMYVLESYETLPSLEPAWLEAIQSHPLSNYSNILFPVLCLLPVLLFLSWVYLGRAEKKTPS